MASTPDLWLELWQTWKTSADSKRYKNVGLQEPQRNAKARSPFIRQIVGSLPLQPNLTTALDHHLEPILALAQIA